MPDESARRGRNAAIEPAQLVKRFEPPLVAGIAGRYGVVQPAQQQRNAVIEHLHPRRKGHRLFKREAESALAGIDIERAAALPGVGAGKHVPFGKLDGAVDHRLRIDGGEGRSGAGIKAVEHVDRRLRRDRAHAFGLGKIGNEESAAAGFCKRAGDRTDAAAIGVGAHHCGAFRLRLFGQSLVIGGEIEQIDFQDAAGLGLRRSVDADAGGKAFIVNLKPAAFIDDPAVDRAVDHDTGARFDDQVAEQVAAHVQRAIALHDRIGQHRTLNLG
jgi:hypothetical protein